LAVTKIRDNVVSFISLCGSDVSNRHGAKFYKYYFIARIQLLSDNPTGGMSFHQMIAKAQSPNFHQLFC
jgi:hypothetical protein